MTIPEAAIVLRPGTSWHFDGVKLIPADEFTKSVSIPTAQDLQACIASVAYSELRARNYPAIGDQLDAIMKGGQALIDMQAMCMAVKAKFPKPS